MGCCSVLYRLKFLFWKLRFRKYSEVGRDDYGNVYFELRNGGIAKRLVFYSGISEPTKIPPGWHVWLHNSVINPPSVSDDCGDVGRVGDFHRVNVTGTLYSYLPSCFVSGESVNRVHYVPWAPKDS